MGLEQLASIKERWFREALRTRLRLFSACLSALGRPALDIAKTSIRFTRSLPQDREENARVISLLKGAVPQEALLALLPEETAAGGPA
jgi:SPP1 family phage portal protein